MIKKIGLFLTNPSKRFSFLNNRGVFKHIEDETFLKWQYKANFGVPLHLSFPRTFNEKMQWLKLHDRNPDYTQYVDKYKVREFVAEVIGDEYLIPLLGVWDSPDKVDFSNLPNRFVLKCNHNSGMGMYICRNKKELKEEEVIANLRKGLSQDYYWLFREWPYKDVEKRIIAEQFISDGVNDELRDYKVFVFNGKAKYIQVDINRFSNHKRNFYSVDWEYIPFTTCYPTAPEIKIERPEQLDELLFLSEKLTKAAGTPPFLRVDMYVLKERILFGEMTFYHGAGLEKFYPAEYDLNLGNEIELPPFN